MKALFHYGFACTEITHKKGNHTYPYLLHIFQDGLVEVVPVDVLREELGELVGHAIGQDIALDGGGAPLGVHREEVRDIELQQVHDEFLGSALLQVALGS